MPSLAEMSFSAVAISNACARLSSAHGPAITANGSALPNLTEPAVTTGAASVTKLSLPESGGPCRVARGRSTLDLLENEGCAEGGSGCCHERIQLPLKRDAARFGASLQRFASRDADAQAGERHALAVRCHSDAKAVAKRHRLDDLDIAARRARRDTCRGGVQLSFTGEG